MKFRYSCVYAPDIEELDYICDNQDTVTYEEVLENIGAEEMLVLSVRLGYHKYDFGINEDWSVSFHKSELPDGSLVYYVCHSAIEYIYY